MNARAGQFLGSHISGWRRFAWSWGCAILLGAGAVLAYGVHRSSQNRQLQGRGRPVPGVASDRVERDQAVPAPRLPELLALAPARVAELPLAQLNLLCARGLSATNEPDPQACTAMLAAWAARVGSETERHQHRFQRNPEEFENSEGFFRMLMLCVVLTEDYGISYDPERRAGPVESQAEDGFFADPSAVFLHGLLGPERKGTCSSLPVLYVAVGRHLGYPLKLVTTRGHLFVRWEDERERFNVETTARGLSRFEDDYYRHWPFEVTPAEEAAEGYLKSLSASEELAVFLSIRGMCLREQGRFSEAVESFRVAAQFAPACRSYRQIAASLERRLGAADETDPAAKVYRSGAPRLNL